MKWFITYIAGIDYTFDVFDNRQKAIERRDELRMDLDHYSEVSEPLSDLWEFLEKQRDFQKERQKEYKKHSNTWEMYAERIEFLQLIIDQELDGEE